MSPVKHQNAESVDGKGFAGEAGLPWGRGYDAGEAIRRWRGGEIRMPIEFKEVGGG